MTDGHDRRREARVRFDSLGMPFQGIRQADALGFQYVLMDFSSQGLQIAIPGWVAAWEKLLVGDVIDFGLPLRVGSQIGHLGTIRWLRWQEEAREQYCGALLLPPGPYAEPGAIAVDIEDGGARVVLDGSRSLAELAHTTLRDAELLKKSLLIHLDHLLPFFQRLASDRDTYAQIRELVLDDVRARVAANHARLQEWARATVGGAPDRFPLPAGFDLEEFRQCMESEIPTVLFRMTFEGEVILRYLEEIKRVEQRLCRDFNTLVLINVLRLEGGA
ncbi:MAG: hypothetical protein OZSIB_3189 [Candidatus Ozemobacter sibiricus]|uniref:PilZ domain-containing protein n=1 Tax=Candidatus Ozemobacter sibiricus TaxID=2268124 RepID=A0A367ZQQ6_9BACT|nr:MAG: hypothetical protein OZSIB_3189 [Candidatus Ozemobacter sibiricus]